MALCALCLHADMSYAVWSGNVLELHDNFFLPADFHLGALQILIAALRVKYSLINNNRKVTLDYCSTSLLWRQRHLPVHNIFFSPAPGKILTGWITINFQLEKHWQALKDGFEEKPWTAKDVNYSRMKKLQGVIGMGDYLTALAPKHNFCCKTPHHMCFAWLWLII